MSNNNINTNNLLKTNVEVEPVAVVFNLTASVIENAIYNYFQKAGISGIAAVRINARKSGNNPEVLVYAFFNKESEDVISNLRDVPPHLRNKMGSNVYQSSEKLNKTLRGVARNGQLGIKNGFVYARLDIFRCLAVVLNCDPRVHTITINEVMALKKENCILSVIKGLKYTGGSKPSTDQYSRIMESLER